MAFYVYAWRDVRNADDATATVGTKDVPRVESTVRQFVIEKGTDPTTADLLIPIKDTFSNIEMDATAYVALVADAQAAATAANRADDTVTVNSFRWGKSVLQFGIGYHASNANTAMANINWKDLS